MARDYLSVSATSASQERVFSSAADIAIPSRGAMSPSTISHLVGCREWLKAGIKVEGKFAEALEYIERYIKTSDKRPNALGI